MGDSNGEMLDRGISFFSTYKSRYQTNDGFVISSYCPIIWPHFQPAKPAEMMTHEEVIALKQKKKLITTATEQFNSKPAKGITYLQEVGLVSSLS